LLYFTFLSFEMHQKKEKRGNKIERFVLISLLFFQTLLFGQQPESVVFYTEDSGKITADLYPAGKRAVVLAHGAVFNKESWAPLAKKLVHSAITVLAIDFRGYGASKPGSKTYALEQDITGAITYLHSLGYDTVSVLGASMGGGAAARAAVQAGPGQIDRLILLSPVPIKNPQQIHARRIFYIASKEEGLAASVQNQYERAPQPKKIYWIKGTAHAQHIFKTGRADELTRLIVDLLKK